jgi:hypothetical protein
MLISGHARARLEEHTGLPISKSVAYSLFSRSRHLSVDQVRLLGYRPGYETRLSQGRRSWYFRMHVFGQELLAVIGEGELPGEYVWVTTYAPNPQSHHLRLGEPELLTAA